MNEVRGEVLDDRLIIYLSGHIDSNNAAEAEKTILEIIAGAPGKQIVLDAADLKYISSAGLRTILHLRKQYSSLKIINVSSDVYEIFDMTGFTQMMDIEKAYRVVSVEGCEVIGQGANGTIYRIDQDNVVKVYKNADALEEIQHEREVARKALILGIPTAISYDVVRVGDSYGSVFELLNAKSFSQILEAAPERMDWCVDEFTAMLKKIHSTLVPEGDLPDIRATAIGWTEFLRDYLPEDAAEKLQQLIKDVPQDNHMIHGDYHTKNLELTGDEVLLIDMDTLAVGHPIFELASMYNAFIGFSEYDHGNVKEFLGFDYDTSMLFWHKVLGKYLGTNSPEKIREVEDKARIVGYTRLIRRMIRRKGMETEEGRAQISLWKGELIELLSKTDSLLFARNELLVEAVRENLQTVLDFIESHLGEPDCPPKSKMQILLAAEEVFINIASYAYQPDKGNAIVRVEVSEEPVCVTITFMDNGIPYDPLAKDDPDITLSAEEREIGGLGIFMVKSTMDDVNYEYRNGQNILTLKKNI